MCNKFTLVILILLLCSTACATPQDSTEISPPEPEPSPTPEPPLPTSTPEPTQEPTPEPSPIPTDPGPGFEKIFHLAYSPDGSSAQKLDLFLPTGDKQHPQTLLMLHGGRGHRADMYSAASYFVERGYQVVVIGFRDWPEFNYPVPGEDVFCAVAWMSVNQEEYGFNLDQLVPYGFSFGATLGSTLVLEANPEKYLSSCAYNWPEKIRFAGLVGFSGIYDYRKTVELAPDLAEYTTSYLGASLEENPEIYAQASPASQVDGDEPPVFFIHGIKDHIPVGNVHFFADLLTQAGVTVITNYPENLGHGALIKSADHLIMVEEFLTDLP